VTLVTDDESDLAPLLPKLARHWNADSVELTEVRRLSAGASRISWSVDVMVDGSTHPLVVQRERVAGKGRIAVTTEARLFRVAAAHRVPVPEVVIVEESQDAIGGAYVITTRIDGETLPTRILRIEELSPARRVFAYQCGQILRAIHSIPTEEFELLPETDPVEAIETMLDGTHDPRPAFEIGLRWLRENRPGRIARTLVHGDFRNGNLIVGSEGIRAVLDWELAHIGDPLEDLAWLCLRAWRWGGPGIVGGIGSFDELSEGYGGDHDLLRDRAWLFWWLLLGTIKWGVICLEQARTHMSGEARSVELAVLGRQANEMEYEVMRMLP
jgi:aminoglycoside phosphotransferase (APT) family kinase protein